MTGSKEKEMRMKGTDEAPRRRWRRVPALVAIMIVAGIVVTPAIGGAAAFLSKSKADKRYLQNTSTARTTQAVPDDGFAAITVNCPPGLQAIGGGVETPAFASQATPTGIATLESKPVGSGRPSGWYVEVANLFGSDTHQVTAVAVCSK